MTPLCEHCGESGKPSKHTRFGVFLCDSCLVATEELEALRNKEEKEKQNELASSPRAIVDSSIAFEILRKREVPKTIQNIEILERWFHTNELPMIRLLSDTELEFQYELYSLRYKFYKATLEMRKTDRFREAQVIKRQTRSDKSSAKVTKENEKQAKRDSPPVKMTKEERGQKQAIEALAKLGISFDFSKVKK